MYDKKLHVGNYNSGTRSIVDRQAGGRQHYDRDYETHNPLRDPRNIPGTEPNMLVI